MENRIWSLITLVMIIALVLPPLVVFHSYSQRGGEGRSESTGVSVRLREVSNEKGFLLDGLPLAKGKATNTDESTVTVIMAQLRGASGMCTQQLLNTALLKYVTEIILVIDSSFPYRRSLPVLITSIQQQVFTESHFSLNGLPNPSEFDLLAIRPGDLLEFSGQSGSSLTIRISLSKESISLPEAYNIGAGLISPGQTHILFSHASLDPHSVLSLEGLLKPLQGKDGLVGCPLLTNETSSDYQIISHGLGVDAPNIHGGLLVATQRLSGVQEKDAGTRSRQRLVPLTRPECLLVSRRVWDSFGPFNTTVVRANKHRGSFLLVHELLSLLTDAREVDSMVTILQDLIQISHLFDGRGPQDDISFILNNKIQKLNELQEYAMTQVTQYLETDSSGIDRNPHGNVDITTTMKKNIKKLTDQVQKLSDDTEVTYDKKGRNNVLLIGGMLFSTLADVPVDGLPVTCQQEFMQVPTGWVLGSDDENSLLVGEHTWSTDALVTSRGTLIYTTRGGEPSSGHLLRKGSLLKPANCPLQVLIKTTIAITQKVTDNADLKSKILQQCNEVLEYSDYLLESITKKSAMLKGKPLIELTHSSLGIETGFDFIIRTKHQVVLPSISDSRWILPKGAMREVDEKSNLPFLKPKYTLSVQGNIPLISVDESWSRSSLGVLQSGKIRIIWHAWCCNCCGFSNEMSHFLVPLRTTALGPNIMTTAAPSCFCSGHPESVTAAIERMLVEDASPYMRRHALSDAHTVWISHSDPSAYALFAPTGPDYFVGRSMYEFTLIDIEWVQRANSVLVDEIWVPSQFVKTVFYESGVDPRKLRIVPEAVDTLLWSPAVGETSFEALIRSGNFPPRSWKHASIHPSRTPVGTDTIFLSVFKWEGRKGWTFLIDAFAKHFTAADDTCLIISTHIWQPEAGDAKDLRDPFAIKNFILDHLGSKGDTSQLPCILILTEELAENDMVELFRAADAFVLPTRGEGWGLPCQQAMSIGLPTISTRFGGSTHFMNDRNSLLVDVQSIDEIPRNCSYTYQPGKSWATPSVPHLVRHIKWVLNNRQEARRLGARARQDMIENYSEPVVAELLLRNFKRIEKIIHKRKLKARASSH